MLIHVYSCAGGHYLHLPTKDDFSKVPPDIMTKLGGLVSQKFIKTYDLQHSDLVGVNFSAVKADIAAKGFHVSRVLISTKERTV